MHSATVTHLVVCRPAIVGAGRFLALCGEVVTGLEHAARSGEPTCDTCRELDEQSAAPLIGLRTVVQ